MARRHSDALAIMEGACNPRAIVNSIQRGYEEIAAETSFKGTSSYTNDAAIRLMIHQLAYISGVVSTVHDWPREKVNFGDAYQQCKDYAKVTA